VELPAPPRRERTLTLAVLLLTALACLAMAAALRADAAYFFAANTAVDMGELSKIGAPSELVPNSYVRMSGLLGARSAIRYERPFDNDTFRVQPAMGRRDLFVELHLDAKEESPRFVPPTTFAGRAVRLRDAGLRYRGLARAIEAKTGIVPTDDAVLVIDGDAPAAARGSLALAVMFVAFALWNLGAIARIVRRAS
jgi:hypothetical protein